MLSVAILSAFIVASLIVLPALAEIRSKRRDEDSQPDAASDDEDPDLLLAA